MFWYGFYFFDCFFPFKLKIHEKTQRFTTKFQELKELCSLLIIWMRKAIIDLGTNTFHLLISENEEVILKKSTVVKLGEKGISQGYITAEAMDRGILALENFKSLIDSFQVESGNVFAFGTSALRNAKNAEDFVKSVTKKIGIKIHVISGDREAELIFKGVQSAGIFPGTSLIMDIGGGSVEFILCAKGILLWKQSFEIGGMRLMERFMKSDPIDQGSVKKMDSYFLEVLLPLFNACHQYCPTSIVGSSGSFDTLTEMHYHQEFNHSAPKDQSSFTLPMEIFYDLYEKMIFNKREERLKIPGMIEMRVDMIVVASCLIRFLIQHLKIQHLYTSRYALKEGVLSEIKHA